MYSNCEKGLFWTKKWAYAGLKLYLSVTLIDLKVSEYVSLYLQNQTKRISIFFPIHNGAMLWITKIF